MSGDQPRQPVLSVVRGSPTAAELAAVIAVLGSLGPPAAPSAPSTRRAEWSARSRLMRAPVAAGPGAWRAIALPR